jgi:predicted O-methyltransferase YrrM
MRAATPRPSAGSAAELVQLATGYFTARAIGAAAELRLADRLADGARSADDLAGETGTHAPSLYRLLRALAAAGVLAHTDDDRFALAPLGELLRADAPGSVRPAVTMFHHPMFWRSWEGLVDSVRTGVPALDRVFGRPVFEYLAAEPEAAAAYNGGMTGLNAALVPLVVAAYDFSRFTRIVDVAGGHGSFLAAVLEAAPEVRGVLIDLPHAARVARRELAARGLAERVEVVDGSMFDAVPPDGDAYLLKWILHDWADERCRAILASIRAAIRPGGRLLIVERVLPERAEASPAARAMMMADLLMMVHLEGRERTEREFRLLLEASGFEVARVVPTASQLSIVEAVPA